MEINYTQIFGGLVIAAGTWVASNFLSAQTDLKVLTESVKVLQQTINEMKVELKEQRIIFATKEEVLRLERRVETIEKKK